MPRTEAGKWLESEEPYLTTWAWGGMGTPVIDAIEREAAIPDRDALARALYEAWPSHLEGGSSYTTQSISHAPSYRVWDPALPSQELADAIITALKEQA